jgi:hypothetical protein
MVRCFWAKRETEDLGFIVRTSPSKVTSVKDWPLPETQEILAKSRLFRSLSRTVPYTKTMLLPADAAGKRPGQSATTIATAGNIPCIYHHAAFQRQLTTDEQQTSLAARHYSHRNIHRRQDLSLDAVRPTAGRNSLPHHHIREYRS